MASHRISIYGLEWTGYTGLLEVDDKRLGVYDIYTL